MRRLTADNRIALVTGASRSVGKGIALGLGSDGWTVYCTARGRGSNLDDTAAEVTARGGRGVAVACDHRDDDQVAALFARIDAETGGCLDVLVNNVWAAPKGFGGYREPFWQRPIGDWDSLIGVGLRAHYVASVHAARSMVPRGSGLILNISSFGTRKYLHSVLYGMSKAGLDKMTPDMAIELGGTGVHVLSLWPGLVRNELIESSGIETYAGFSFALAETPEFLGRVVVALVNDAQIGRRSGDTIVTAEAGTQYGIADEDGTVPESHRAAFGGGPVFGSGGAQSG